MKLSFSKISTYKRCPLLFKYRNILKIPCVHSEVLYLGSTLHIFFDMYNKYCMAKMVLTAIGEVENLATQALVEGERQGIVLSASAKKDHYYLADRFAYKETVDHKKIYGTEEKFGLTKEFEITDFDADEAYIRLVMDKISVEGKTAIICDYKTGFAEGDINQLKIYAVAAFMLMPEMLHVRGQFLNVRTAFLEQHTFNREDLPVMIDEIQRDCDVLEKAIEKDNFPAKPSYSCTTCEYAKICNHVPTSMTMAADETDAIQIAEDLTNLEAKSKEKKKALKEYCLVNGDIKMPGGGIWGITASEKFSTTDPVKVVASCKTHGVNARQLKKLISISGAELKNIVRADEEILNEVQNELDIKITNTFKLRKI